MCHWTCIEFVESVLDDDDVEGKRVLEVGSLDVNGSVRPAVEELAPASYLGVDIAPGPRVDEICSAESLVARFGEDSFDVVISTEMVEHVRAWQDVFWNMKSVVRPGGTLIVTTRSPGFKTHGYPYDFWRYTVDDMRVIFNDFEIDAITDDAVAPGVFVAATKPTDWKPNAVSVPLHSVITGKRCYTVSGRQVAHFKLRYRAHMFYRATVPERVRAPVKRLVGRVTRGR